MLQPYIPPSELILRREKISHILPKNTVLILLSNPLIYRNSDVEYPYYQNSNFWYLTGINQPETIFLSLKDTDGKLTNYLFLELSSKKDEVWTGKGLDFEEAKTISQVNKVLPLSKFFDFLEGKIDSKWNVCLDENVPNKEFIKKINQILKAKKIKPEKASLILKELRLIKSEWEISQIKKAVDITLKTHKIVEQNLPYYPLLKGEKQLNEFQLEAEILRNFQYYGASWAYYPIVASGKNATILHYNKNNQFFDKQDLILIDAGCEYNYYSSDITRVYCQQKITTRQQEIYDLVNNSQQEIITFLEENIFNLNIKELNNFTIQSLVKGMMQLGIFKESLEEIIDKGLYKKYYPHSVSHFLGLDTHDLCEIEDYKTRKLEKGMVITIEPGLYFSQTNNNSFLYQNIGVRIEDNFLITEKSIENLAKI